MATIKTPAAGVSPYQTAATAPAVLRADANGNTVLANPTATATAAANANTNVIVNGNEALNSLIATSRSGVFEGANVTINLEEQLFNTTNQVTSTTNYPSGGTGEIQYNSGSNSFSSSAYLTYNNGNVVTPGIRTDGYFYGNGAPFIGGGNAAIGNFVFNGDTMTISDDANISLTIQGNSLGNNLNQIIINPTSVDLYAFNNNPYSYSELYLDNGNTEAPYAQIIIDGNSTPQQTWNFDATGNLTLPSNTSSINYANGDPYGGTGTGTGNYTFSGNVVEMPLTAQLNSGGIGFPNSAEFGTEVTNILPSGSITGSQIYMSAGTGEGRIIVNSDGNALTYYGVENPGFAGTVAMDPGVTSEYAIQVGSNKQIEIGAVIGNITTTEYVAGIGVLNETANITGLFANANVAVIGAGNTGWAFDAGGNLTLPGNTFAVNYANGDPVSLSGLTLVPNDVTYQTGSIYGNANAGFTVVTTQDDDQSYNVPIDFPIEFLGNAYTNGNVYLVSNSYLTFGASATNYIPVGPGTVPVPAIFVGATDLSNQKYYYGYADGTDVYVIGYEGSNDTYGETGYSNITWEMQVNSATPDQINIVTNLTAQQPGSVWGVSNGAEWVDQFHPLPWFSSYADSTFNSVLIAPVTPQAATNIAFTGPGVTIGQDSGTTYVNIDPFDSVISVGTGGEGGSAQLSSVYADLILTTPTDGSGIYVVPQGAVYIRGGNASNTHPGNGYDVSLVGGNAHDNPNTPGQDYGGGNITLLTGSAVGNSRPGQISFGVGNYLWFFEPTGGTRFPNLTVERGDNPSGTIQGQTLLFSDPTTEAIITTPNGPNVTFPNSQRLVINPGAGAANTSGEGGDIYLWAGRGGNASGSGGDIKIRGGSGGDGSAGGNGGDGGYIRIEAGDGYTTNTPGGVAGFVEMTAGVGGENRQGGYVRITGGQGGSDATPSGIGGGDANIQGGYGRVNGTGGNVNLIGGIAANGLAYYGNVNINSGASTWLFDNQGNLTTPGSSGNITGANVISANVFTAPANVIILSADSTWTFNDGGNLTLPNDTVIGNAISQVSQGPALNSTGAGYVGTFTTLNYTPPNAVAIGWTVNGPGVTDGIVDNVDEFTTAVGMAVAGGQQFQAGESYTFTSPVFGIGSNLTVNGNTWTFSSDGNLTFPTGMHIDNEGANTRISQNEGYLKMTAGDAATFKAGWTESEGDGTGPVAQVIANDVGAGYPGNLVIRTGNLSTTTYEWFFDNTGNTTLPGNISTTGNITGAYFFGNGSQLTDVGAATVPSQNILPTIQTITATPMLVGYLGGGQGGVTVTVANTIQVTEYGVIVTAGTNVQTYAPGDLGSIPGTGNITFTTGLSSPASFTVYAYVTSNAGTYYSNAVIGTSGMCLLAGTQIALSDGSHKAIEHITYTDKMLSWDFDRGCYAETTALWIKRSETGSQYNLLTFSDGTTLRTFDQHRIFNKQAGAFTYPMTEATPVGTVTVNEHGQEITLTNKQVIQDTIEYYNVITDYHMNLFSDSVLTSCRFNNIYPITDMKFAKDGRTLRTRAEFENVEDRFFHGLRLAEQTADIETVEWYVNRLLATEVSTQVELVF